MNQQIDIDEVAKLLGHKDIAAIQARAKIKALKAEVEALKKQLKEREE